MSKRYSRIKQAATLQAALTHYINKLSTPHTPQVGTKDKRPARTTLYLKPFNITVGTTEYVKSFATTTTWNADKEAFASRTISTLPEGGTTIALRGFKAARVNIVTPDPEKGTATPSKITGQSYLKYNKKSTSIPFGRVPADSSEGNAFATIKTAGVFTGKKLYLIAEQYSAG